MADREDGGYCGEIEGENLDELLILGALKQKQQSDEMIKNLGTEATQPVFLSGWSPLV